MPYPPPEISQWFRWARVAFSNLGYHTRATVVLPSMRPTLRLSSVKPTEETRSSALRAKIPMSGVQELFPLRRYNQIHSHLKPARRSSPAFAAAESVSPQ